MTTNEHLPREESSATLPSPFASGLGETDTISTSINTDISAFLNVLFAGFAGDLPFVLNEEITKSSDPEFIAQNTGALRVRSADDGNVFFVFDAQEDTARDAYLSYPVKPSAVLWKDGVSIYLLALDNPVPETDARVVALMEHLKMDLGEAIPLPGTDGWELVNVDADNFYTADELAATYLEEIPEEPVEEAEPVTMYGQAVVKTPYDEAAIKERQITVAIGANQFSKMWQPQKLPLAGLIHQLTKHEVGKKDGLAIVLGDMLKGQRKKIAIKSCTAIGLDIDTGTPSAVVDAAIAKLNCLAVRSTTHSHGKQSSEIKKDNILKFRPEADEITTDLIRDYLREKERWDESIIKSTKFVEEDQTTEKGIVCRISHDPMPKHRVIVPVIHPYIIADEGRTQQEAMAKWAKVPAALADLLGVPFDRSCTDPSRLYYLGRHAKDQPYEISLFGGPLFDLKTLQLDNAFDAVAAEFQKGGSKSVTAEGKAFGKWWVKYAHGFQIMDVIQEFTADRVRSEATSGYNIECPFDSDHGNAGDSSDQACFAVNAADGGNEFFLVSCRHESCRDKTSNDMLGRMVKDEWFEEKVLYDQQWNVAEIEEETPNQEALPTLTELKNKIGELKSSDERDKWHPMVEAIADAKHLAPGDLKAAKDALIKQVKSLTPSVLKEELKLLASKSLPVVIDPNASKESEKISEALVEVFGTTFALPVLRSGGEELRCEIIDGTPWYKGPILDAEGNTMFVPFCTPFTLDGVVRYVDKDGEEALRIRLLNGDEQVVTVECDASALVKFKGSDVISAMVAKGWRCEDEGEKAAIRYFKTQQRRTSKVYHRPGYREGVFVLGNGAVIAPDGQAANVELHADSLLKGPIKAGSLEGSKAAAAVIFSESVSDETDGEATEHPKLSKLWHHQFGYLSGLGGALIGYLGRESVHVHLGGGTTHSKTAAMMNGGAAWATPKAVGSGDSHDGCVRNAAGTLNSYENIMQKMSCMMLALDEFGKIAAKDQAEFAFKVQGGKGRSRMGKDTSERAIKQWHGLFVVTAAENSIGQILAAANQRFDPGMTARLLPVNFADTFYFDEDSDEWKAVLALHANYGHSGEAFVRTLVSIDPEEIRKVLTEFVDKLCTVNSKTLSGKADGKPTGLELRACANVAYVWLAAELAISADLIPGTYDPEPLARKLWLDFITSDTAPIEPAERAFETLMSGLTGGKGLNIVGFEHREDQRSQEAYGFHSVPDNGEETFHAELNYVIYAQHLGKLSGNNGNPDTLRKMLDDRGYLVRPNGERGKKALTHPTFPKLGRGPFIVLRAKKVDEPEPDSET